MAPNQTRDLRSGNGTHPPSSAVAKDRDDEKPFYRSTLFKEFARRPSVTTMESKFFVSSRVGEFWCTVTSPVYAAPCIFWTISDLPPSIHMVLSCCALTAIFSTAYHWLLTKVKPYSHLVLCKHQFPEAIFATDTVNSGCCASNHNILPRRSASCWDYGGFYDQRPDTHST
jgi:hypothetical protein